jgi:hypothetical protein
VDKKAQYWTWEHNIEGCLRNGSFVRKSRHGLGQFMNGDFMGFIDAVPEGMCSVDTVKAFRLIPTCCR